MIEKIEPEAAASKKIEKVFKVFTDSKLC